MLRNMLAGLLALCALESTGQCATISIDTTMSCNELPMTLWVEIISTCFEDANVVDAVATYTSSTNETGTITLFPGGGFYGLFQLYQGADEVCVTVDYLDQFGVILYSTTQCADTYWFPPLTITGISIDPASPCGVIADGCVEVSVTGGTPPYILNVFDGEFLESLELCGILPGNYQATVFDAMWCQTSIPFEVSAEPIEALSIIAFFDMNGNGVLDDNFLLSEPTLPDMGFTIVEADLNVYTNEVGMTTVPGLPPGMYSIDFIETGGWTCTQDVVSTSESGCVIMPMTNTEDAISFMATPVFNTTIFHCMSGYFLGVSVNNTGTQPMDAEVSISFNPTLVAAATPPSEPLTSSTPGAVTWYIDGMSAGSESYYLAHFDPIGLEFLGEVFSFDISFTLLDSAGEVAYTLGWTIDAVYSCSYDPNDLASFPEGYAGPRYVMPGTELTYRVRFQNTGNAPAEDVVITDLLDPDRFDLSTFYHVYASHDHMVSLSNDGILTYTFDGIQLPDSTSDEEGSNGMALFRISLRDDLVFEEVVENTAFIYFDLNPPIITNTVTHTIYDCAQLPQLDPSAVICLGDTINNGTDYPYIHSFNWSWDGESISAGPVLEFEASEEGTHYLFLEVSNPLCAVSSTQEYTISAPETPVVFYDQIFVYTTAEGTITWTYNGAQVGNATDNSTLNVGNGMYTATMTNSYGCSSSDSSNVILDAEDWANYHPRFFPNPIADESLLSLPPGEWTLQLVDAAGRLAEGRTSAQGFQRYSRYGLESGFYVLSVSDGDTVRWTVPVVVE